MFFSDLKIKNKIIATSAIIMIAMIGLISISYIFFGKIGNEMDTFYKVQYVNTKNQMEIRRDIQTINKRILVALISQDTNVVDEQISDFDKRFDKMESIINDMEKTLGDQALVESMKSSLQNLKSGSYELMNLAKAGQNEEAIAVYNTTFNDVISEGFADILSEVGALSDKQAEDQYAKSVKIGNQAVIVLVIVAIISLAIIMFAFLLLIKNIIKPVTALEVAAEKMENGDFDINIDYESKDELGELANGFRIMSENTREIIIDTNRLLDEMANRNFNVASECRDNYVGEYQKLYTGICDVRDNMTHALTEVKQASEQVNISSEQVSSVANHLAQGATEQSLAIDELLTRIQEITNQTNSNVSNAIDTSNLAQEAGNGINNANNSMNSLMLAIDDINIKSTEIGKIIKTIDDIAFQTNILALNAAVEAARAGESGRGFSVVADEVRNLAGKSAEASKNIADLIKSTIDSISNGTALANETEDNLINVVTSASNMVNLVDEIVKSSENQAQSISQIKMGIEQISQVVQNNSATAEEVAATSEELSGQANAMKELVEQFTLEESLIL